MANLSNINNKFLVTTGGNVLIGQTSAVGSSIFQVTGNSTFTGNATVGTGIIKSSIGGDIAITQGAIGLRINDAASAISPTTATSNNDNAIDLGVSNIRFKDLYLGGSITSGGATFAGDITISKTYPKLILNDTQGVPRKFSVGVDNETFTIRNETGTSNSLTIVGGTNAATFAGNVGIGIAPPKKLTVFGTGVGNATVQIEGEGGADPYINFLANNTQHWSLGVDDSDSDKFKLSKHSALGTNDYFAVDTSGNSTFAGKVRANSWFQGASGTNTLWSNVTAGVLIQTAGSTANNNDSKIFFRNSGDIVKHTFDTNNGNATFVGNANTSGSIRVAGGTDQGSQLCLFADSNGHTSLAGFDFEINTGSNNSRARSFFINSSGATFAGSVTAAAIAITTLTTNNIQLNGSFTVLNKAQTSYLPFATRDTTGSEVLYNLTNVGSATFFKPITIEGTVAGSNFPIYKTKISAPFTGGWNTLAPGTVIGGLQQTNVRSDTAQNNIAAAVEFYLESNTFGTGRTGILFKTGGVNGVNSPERMRLDGNGVLTVSGSNTSAVGIGTTSPTSKLHVVGSNTGSIPLVDLRASGTGTFQRGVRLLNAGMNVGDHIMYAIGQSDSSKNMGQTYFYYAGSGSTSNRISMGLHGVDDVFNILGTGNVGIGRTNPSAKLHVQSTANADVVFKLENTNTGTSAGARIELICDEAGSGSGGGELSHSIGSYSQTVGNWIIESGSAAGQLDFSTVDAFAMRIDEAQRVGIGTTSPFSTAKLQIKTATNVNLAFQTGTTETTGFKINAFNDAANANIPLELNGSVVLLKTLETERMRITSTGDFLVRNTSSAVFDTNTGASVAQFWGNQFSASNNTASKVIIGSATNIALVGGAN